MSGPGVFENDPGSFRDPSGFVIHSEDRVFRVLTEVALPAIDAATESGLLRELSDARKIVGTTTLDEGEQLSRIKSTFPEAKRVLEHQRIDLLTYPTEWTLSMLADAGILTLAVQIAAVRKGLSLQDASAYNVQFIGTKPVFIDVTSLQIEKRRDIWLALGQFYRHFLYPMLLKLHRGASTKGYFLENIDGLDSTNVARILGKGTLLSPARLFDVWLPSWLSKKDAPAKNQADGAQAQAGNPEVQVFTLQRQKSKLSKLRKAFKSRSDWSSYEKTCTYNDESEREKIEFVDRALNDLKPSWTLDLGCNTGNYSRIAAKHSKRVIALDQDHDSLDSLYRKFSLDPELRDKVHIVWSGIDNPTPAIGWTNSERKSLFERISADVVLALALVHHLLVTGRVPLGRLVEFFSGIASRALIIEFVSPADPMFTKLAAFRKDLYEGISEESFRIAFEKEFEVVDRKSLGGGTRTIFRLEKREPNERPKPGTDL
ncbi:MAG: hypothetical protein NUW37_01095 [Planctomycetes bacterium]|nr:hypothetical protein [Planctomycetota bacterium]